MTHSPRLTVILSVAIAVTFVPTRAALAQEETITQEQIPSAVMNAVRAKFPTAKIEKSAREKENGVVIYDLEFTQNGRKTEADIREDGSYINYELAIPANTLPKVVRAAVGKHARGATIKEVMEETAVDGQDEKRSAYEVVLVGPSKDEFELRLAPDGKVLEDSRTEAKAKP